MGRKKSSTERNCVRDSLDSTKSWFIVEDKNAVLKKLNLKKFEVLMCVAVNLSQNTWRCVDDAYMGLDISHGHLNFNLFAQQKMYAWKAQAKQNDAQTRE